MRVKSAISIGTKAAAARKPLPFTTPPPPPPPPTAPIAQSSPKCFRHFQSCIISLHSIYGIITTPRFH